MKKHGGLWQTRLGRCVFESSQGHQVWQNPFYRWLSFSSDPVQSILHRYRPQKPVTACVNTMGFAVRQCPGSLLLLGLGGACVPHALLPFRAEKPWTFVEYDPEVLAIAQKYFQLDRLQPCQTEQADAFDFISNTSARYDHILIDLADANQFPPHCATQAFMASCHKRLHDQGLLTLNLHDPAQQRSLFNKVQTLFPATLLFPVPGMANIMMFAAKNLGPCELLEKLQAKQHCRQLGWDREWGMVGQF